jgi:hypothetical protein
LPNIEFLDFITKNETLLWTLGIVSLITFFASLLVIPWLVMRIPVDYFAERKRHRIPWANQHPVVRWTLLIIKNLLGIVFIILGLAMLVLPGQGLLTILIGIILLNFPGKYRFERWLIQLKHVRRAVDWLRHRAGTEPLIFSN